MRLYGNLSKLRVGKRKHKGSSNEKDERGGPGSDVK